MDTKVLKQNFDYHINELRKYYNLTLMDSEPEKERVNKWFPCTELPPTNGIEYLTQSDNGIMQILQYCEGWNCYRDCNGIVCRESEVHDIVAWMFLPEKYRGEQ